MNKKQIDMIFKVLLDNDSENPFRNTLAKVNKAGRYRLRNIDNEDIILNNIIIYNHDDLSSK